MKTQIVWLVLLQSVISSAASESTVYQKRGARISIPCVVPQQNRDNDDVSALYWYKDEKEIMVWQKSSDNPKTDLDEKRFQFDTEYYTLDIDPSELEDSGTYMCQGIGQPTENSTSNEPLFEEAIEVVVHDVPSTPPGKPEVKAISAYEFEVTWEESEEENNSPITDYKIIVRMVEDSWDKADHLSTGKSDPPKYEVIGREPYTTYQVKVVAVNGVGESNESLASDNVTTSEATPSKRALVTVTNRTTYTTAIYVAYKPPDPKEMRGKLLGYIFHSGESTSGTMTPKGMTPEPERTSFNFTELKPFTPYKLGIMAYNSVGEGPVKTILDVWTEEGVPEKPRITHIANRTDTMLQFEWEHPVPNGRLQGYKVFWYLRYNDTAQFNTTVRQHVMSHAITKLEPYTDYMFQVAGFTQKGSGELSDPYPGLTDVKGPSAPINVTLSLNSSTAIYVLWKKPQTWYKQIDEYYVQYQGDDGVVQKKTVLVSEANAKQHHYETVLPNLQPSTQYRIWVSGATKSVFYPKFYIGESSPVKIAILPGAGGDEPVKAGVIAGIVCVTFLLILTIIGFIVLRRYWAVYRPVPDGESSNIPTTVITLPETFAKKQEKNDTEHEALLTSDWAAHVTRLHADSDLGFSQEYEEINRATRPDLTAMQSTDPENKHKNRYINILAYDHSRVVLKQLPGKPRQSDYINGNYVDAYHKPQAYVATQGPLPGTFADFWRMVWELNSSIVCMITNLQEKGRRKCDQYWPNEGETQYGHLTVKLLNVCSMAHYTIRVFTLKCTKTKKRLAQRRRALSQFQKLQRQGSRQRQGSQKLTQERVVYQYHYTDWPDHGVPDFTLPTLTYVRKSAAANPEGAGPIIIHCSAGVGRTGTYICLDSMMRQMRDKGTVNVYGFLSHIRNQRNYLVQTEDQYIFTHDALLEFIQSQLHGDTEIKDSQISKYVMEDLQAESEEGISLLAKQYLLVTAWKPRDFHVNSATLAVNQSKNRDLTLVPVEHARVRLPAQPGEEGSDYINASYLQGYNKRNEYIVTQHPLKTTVSDFWRMVWDQNSMTIVLLTSVDEDTSDDSAFIPFWPEKEEEPADYGHFKVTPRAREEEEGEEKEAERVPNNTRDFLLQSTQDDYEYTARLVLAPQWPTNCNPLSSAFELIHSVRTWHYSNPEVEGPVTVVDKFGGTEAATFCALSTLAEQVQHDNSVDVYMVSKLYHLKRPGIFATQEDYHLLYKAMESNCDESTTSADRDSGISNCNNFPATMPASRVTDSSLNKHSSNSNNMANNKHEATTTM